MKEVQSLLKIVSDGLKTLAQKVEAIAEKVDDVAGAKSPAKRTAKAKAPAAKKTVKAKKAAPAAAKKAAPAAAKKTAPAAAKKAGAKAPTAADTVLAIIDSAAQGVDTAAIKKQTGFDQKKVANIIFKLKKQGKIKTAEKGVYTKV
jgi:DNA replicative helicase MCM subunit Mcm2 (Cdc46/Mcm family)